MKKLSSIISFFGGGMVFCLLSKLMPSGQVQEEKNKRYMQLLDNWLILCERGELIEEYFRMKGIKEIAVYGYGNIGSHLVTQLSNSDIKIQYIIDKRNVPSGPAIDRYRPTDKLPKVEAVIVTPVCEFQEIKNELSNQIPGKIISIEDIIYELL